MNFGIIVRRLIGWFLIVLGFFGLALPFLQGIVFILIGFYILALDSVWWKRQLQKLEKKHPALQKFVTIFDGRVKKSKNYDSR